MEKKINRSVIRTREIDIKVHLIDSFPNHPYHVFDDEDMTELTASIEATEKLMTSQLPALYLSENNQSYRNIYLRKLMAIGFNKTNAEKMFDFECDIIRKHGKKYLQHPQFTELWFFGLRQPFFLQYPKTKEDILKEKYLTMSEICKIVDEAEWHFWNSHEKNLSDEVWAEIYAWHLKGPGIEFATTYFEMIEKETGIPSENISALCGLQGEHLSKYKWK